MSMLPEKIRAIADSAVIEASCEAKDDNCIVKNAACKAFPEARYPRFREYKINGVVQPAFRCVYQGHRGYYSVPEKVTAIAAALFDDGLKDFIKPFRFTLTLLKEERIKKVDKRRQAQASAARKRHTERHGRPADYDRFQKFREEYAQKIRLTA